MAIEIVSFPMKNGGSFHSYVNVYQRVDMPKKKNKLTSEIHQKLDKKSIQVGRADRHLRFRLGSGSHQWHGRIHDPFCQAKKGQCEDRHQHVMYGLVYIYIYIYIIYIYNYNIYIYIYLQITFIFYLTIHHYIDI